MRTSVSNVIARSEPGESSEPIRIHPRDPSVPPTDLTKLEEVTDHLCA